MNKSKIEWTDYTVNPVKGLCPVGCNYCYARAMYHRFKWNPEIAYMPPQELGHLLSNIRKPSRIFMGSTMELFGPWVDPIYREFLLAAASNYPQHTFIFLTKLPQNLPREWPDNCWVGGTATNAESYYDSVSSIAQVKAKVKFVSFEPLLGQINGGECTEEYRLDSIDEFDWLIIGQQTPVRKATMPKVEWVQEIALAATKANIPLFIKDNLKALLPNRMPFWCAYRWWSEDRTHQLSEWRLRQEFPQV